MTEQYNINTQVDMQSSEDQELAGARASCSKGDADVFTSPKIVEEITPPQLKKAGMGAPTVLSIEKTNISIKGMKAGPKCFKK